MNSTQWTTPSRAPRSVDWFGTFIGLFMLVVSLRLGIGTAGTNLDESWSAVIAWAHVHGAQWGSDIVFTYGPLGWLNPYATYNTTLFSTFFASQIALSIGVAVTFGLAASLLRGLDRLLLFVALVVLSPWLHSDVLLLGCLAVAIAAVEHVARSAPHARSTLLLAVVAALCSSLALLKFSFFPLTIGIWLVGTLLLRTRGRRAVAIAWFLGLPATMFALWVANGQAIAGIPAYLRTSLEMAAAYGHAMGTSGELSPLVVCAAAGAIVALLLLAWLRVARSSRLRALAVTAYIAALVFIAWRASFTRADHAHVGFFLPLCALAIVVLMGFARDLPSVGLRRAASFTFVALVAGSLWLVAPGAAPETYRKNASYIASIWRSVFDPAALRAQYEAGRSAVRDRLDLPRVRAIVGTQRVDLLTSGQGLVLVNDLSFAPRPIFQSYAAFTPSLLRLNEAYFLDANAPPFVLLKLEAIDLRYPTSEDSLALLAIWRNYRPIELERDFVLLQRVREERSPIRPAPVSYVDAVTGEWIDVPAHDATLLLHADIALSASGRIFATLLREPALYMEVALDSGEVRQFRMVRGIAAAGFLLSPFLADERAYLHWAYGERQPAVRRVRFVAPVGWQHRLLMPRMRVGFTPVELRREEGSTLPSGLAAALYPGFDLAPVARSGAIEAIVEDEAPALFMHAQATLDFAPRTGRYRVTARYGVRRAAYESADCAKAHADGVHFQIDLLRDNQATTQMQRTLDPFASDNDRGAQIATINTLEVQAGDMLRVTAAPGAKGNGACDWGYLAELRLHPLSP